MRPELNLYSIDSFIERLTQAHLSNGSRISKVKRERIRASLVGGDARLTKVFDFIMIRSINRAGATSESETKRSLKMKRWCRENLGHHLVDFSMCLVFVETDEDLIKLILRFAE